MQMKINYIAHELKPEAFDLWNTFVDASPQGDVFCYTWWLDAITKGNFKILAVFENDEIVAGIPLAYYLGKINEPPLTRTLGPLFKDMPEKSEHDKTTIQRKWLNMLLDEIPMDEFEQFCTSHNFNDWLPFRWRGLKQTTRYTYLINYTKKEEKDLWALLSRGRKETINKAKKNNLSTKVTTDLSDFYRLIELTYQRQGLRSRYSYDEFKLLDDEIVKHKKRVILTTFDDRGNAHAAIYVVFNSEKAFALISAGNPKYRDLGGHTLVMWEAIKYFRIQVKIFNLGGSDIERIEQHLRGFGGKLRQYFHIYKDHPQIREVEKVLEKEVIREFPVLSPAPPDNWKYHIGVVRRHSWILIKKALYKLHIRFNLPVRVSVIVPCYNHGKYIHEMLQSVLKQTYPYYEVIIVNDGSTDDTAKILNRIKHKKVSIFHTANHGPAHARNLAITHAKSDLIVNLDADDKMAPEFLQKCVEVMDAHPNTGIVYTDVECFGHKTGRFVIPEYSFENMLRWNCIVANACFRKDDWEQTEGYSSFFQNGYEDYDFWLSILELGREVHKIETPLMFYRTYENVEMSRSGRRKKDSGKMQEVVIQAFRRHRKLYEKAPEVYKEFILQEKEYAASSNEHPGYNPLPLFSIVTPTSKRVDMLKRNINSLQSQSFSNWEQIIIDDANDMETRNFIKSLSDPRIKYFAHYDSRGAAGARNTGIKNATGKYINFLDDDDEYLPEILEKQKRAFEKVGNDIGFIWTGITRVKDTQDGEETIRTQVWPEEFESRELGLVVSTAIGNGFGLSMKSSCLKKTSFYDETFTVGEDTDFMIRLSKHYNFRTVPEVQVKIHHHGEGQLTHEKYSRIKWESYGRLIKSHRHFLASYWDVYYMHHQVYTGLCFQVHKKWAGFKSLWWLIRLFPNRKIAWLDLLSYLLDGKDYNSGKIKRRLQNFRQSKEYKKQQAARKRSIRRMDDYRKHYDKMTFADLNKVANKWLHIYPEQASYTLPLVIRWFEEHVSQPAMVLEIGGWRGDLAGEILSRFSQVECWHNFDVISDASTQKCRDERYRLIPLNDYIWNLKLPVSYNALIATHVIEHLKWREVKSLIKWIPEQIDTVLFEIPIVESAENYNWQGHHSTHILEKGWKQIIDEMNASGFEVALKEKDTVIFNRIK
jgi:glycosyltransferase involved in cell wall biosynthesis